ncbi:MAG: roadblock/LC7 domain-containing protein [Actinomycetes bacterium]
MTDPYAAALNGAEGRSLQLDQILGALLRQVPDVEAASVVSFDGLPMASALPPGMDEDRVAAMSAALLSLGERAAQGLGRGDLSQVYVEGDNGTVFLVSAEDEAVLVAVGRVGAKVGLMLYEVKQAAAAVGTALAVVAEPLPPIVPVPAPQPVQQVQAPQQPMPAAQPMQPQRVQQPQAMPAQTMPEQTMPAQHMQPAMQPQPVQPIAPQPVQVLAPQHEEPVPQLQAAPSPTDTPTDIASGVPIGDLVDGSADDRSDASTDENGSAERYPHLAPVQDRRPAVVASDGSSWS